MSRIVDYPQLTTPSDSDILVIEDLAAASTKKIARGDLVRYGAAYTSQLGGWYAGTSWTYASATTLNAPAGDVANISIGTKIKLTQTVV